MFFLTLGIFPTRSLFRKNPMGFPGSWVDFCWVARERLSSPHGLDMKIAAEAWPFRGVDRHLGGWYVASFQTVFWKMNEGALEDDFLFQSDDFYRFLGCMLIFRGVEEIRFEWWKIKDLFIFHSTEFVHLHVGRVGRKCLTLVFCMNHVWGTPINLLVLIGW